MLADFNGDHRLDVAMAQNENAVQKKILLATDEVPTDTAAPIIPNYEKLPAIQYPGTEVIRIRAHDNKSPLMLHDFRDVDGEQDGRPYLESWADDLPADPDMTPGDISLPGQWYGEYLWRVQFDVPDADVLYYRLCAIDAAGNKACTKVEMTAIEGGSATESDTMSSMSATDTNTDSNTDSGVSATDTQGPGSATGTDSNTPATESASDANSDTATVPTESNSTTTSSDSSDSTPTGTQSASDSQNTVTTTNSDTNTDSEGPGELNDGGCICNAQSSRGSGWLLLILLGLALSQNRARRRV